MTRALILTVLLSGCASFTASRTARYTVVTEPAGAYVLVDGEVAGVSPATVSVERSHPPRVEVRLAGYLRASCDPQPRIGVRYLVGDIILCLVPIPLVGCASFVDAAGAWNVFDDTCAVTLVPEASPVR